MNNSNNNISKQNCRIYIGRISHNVQSKDIDDIFSKHGKICEIRMNRNFAFVQYLDEQSAQSAISEENGKLYFGKKLDVQFARAPGNEGTNKGPLDASDSGRERSPVRDRSDSLNFGKTGGGVGGGMGRGGNRGVSDGRSSFWTNDSDSPRDFMGGMGGMRGGRGGRGGGVPFRSPSLQGDRPPMRPDDANSSQYPFRQGDMPGGFGGGGGDSFNRGPSGLSNDQPFRAGGVGGGGGPGAASGGGGSGGGGSSDSPFRGPPGLGATEGTFRGGSDPPFRGGQIDTAFRGQGPDGPWSSQPSESSYSRGPGVSDSPFRSPQSDPVRAPLRPPTQQPSTLSTPSADRVNDIEIIVLNKAITDYGEFIERKLKGLGFTVDVLFPNEEVPMGRVLGNIASRGTLYSVIVSPVHQQHRSLTLHILHGLPQEHRNMPVEDAITLISRNFDTYMRQCKEKRGKTAPPENIRHMIEQILAGKDLTGVQYEKLAQFFTQEKLRVEPTGSVNSGETATQEAELQNRILNILNKTGSGGAPEPVTPQPPPPTQNVGSTPPLLNDPSVQKALDSLIQGDLLRKIAPQQQGFNRF